MWRLPIYPNRRDEIVNEPDKTSGAGCCFATRSSPRKFGKMRPIPLLRRRCLISSGREASRHLESLFQSRSWSNATCKHEHYCSLALYFIKSSSLVSQSSDHHLERFAVCTHNMLLLTRIAEVLHYSCLSRDTRTPTVRCAHTSVLHASLSLRGMFLILMILAHTSRRS